MSETARKFSPDLINEGQADPLGEDEVDVLKYKQGEAGLEEVISEAGSERPGDLGGEVLSAEERRDLDEHIKQMDENRKKWEKDKDPTLLGKFLEKVVGNRFMRTLIPVILIHGYSLSSVESSEKKPEQKIEISMSESESQKASGSEIDVELGVGTEEYKFKTVKEGESRPVLKETEASRMVASEPVSVEMKWARSYDVKEMDEKEVKSLTENINKIIDDYLSKNNITIEDLKKLKEQGVENELLVSGLASPEGDEAKNEKVKADRAHLARELVRQILSERGLSEYFKVKDDTKEGAGAFVDGEWRDRDEVFQKLSEAFSTKNKEDLLDVIKKYNRGQMSEDDMTPEQAQLMKEVFDKNRGVSVSFRGGMIERKAEMNMEKESDKVDEISLKVPTIEKVGIHLKKIKVEEQKKKKIVEQIKRSERRHKKITQLKKADEGILEQFSGIQDPQIYEQLPLGKKGKSGKEIRPPMSPPGDTELPPVILPTPQKPPHYGSRDHFKTVESRIKSGKDFRLTGRTEIFGPNVPRADTQLGTRNFKKGGKSKKGAFRPR